MRGHSHRDAPDHKKEEKLQYLRNSVLKIRFRLQGTVCGVQGKSDQDYVLKTYAASRSFLVKLRFRDS